MPINTDFAETDGVGGEQVASYAYPVPAIVDNDVNSYRIVAGPPGGGAVWPGNQVAVWSVVVTYEIDRLIEVSH